MKKSLFLLALPLLMVACSGSQKKVLVLSHNSPQIDEANNTVICKADKGHEEKELDMSAESLKVSTLAGDATLSMPGKGYYIVNLKNNDTIIGSYVLFTTADQAHSRLTQAELKQKIDSLQQLAQGKNVSAANRNYFIPPNTAVKITDNIDALVFAPFHPIAGVQPTSDGKAPEVYQFYTASEFRELIANLQKLTIATDSTGTGNAAPAKK